MVHKYIGSANPSTENSSATTPTYDVLAETNIQDLLLLENRDRKYDTTIYQVRGVYNVQDLDFNLSQFGLFIDNDTVFMTVHINDFIRVVGRKPLSGDVVELPHLKDEFALNSFNYALPRFFVIEDVGRAAEGFSKTWYPHLYRLKLKKIESGQKYADILNVPANTDDQANFTGEYDPSVTYHPGEIVRYQGKLYTVTNETTGNLPTDTNYFNLYNGLTIDNLLSPQNKSLEINDAVIAQAEADVPLSGYETRQFFTLAVDDKGKALLETVDRADVDASIVNEGLNASAQDAHPMRTGYQGYLVGDGFPDNGIAFGHGIQFPNGPIKGDYFLRTDFLPNRLFVFDGIRWIKREDAVRHTLTNTDSRQTLKTSFINNTKTDVIGGTTVPERQPISKALKPRADF